MAYLFDVEKPCGICVGKGHVVSCDYGLAPIEKGEQGSFPCPRCSGKGMVKEGLPKAPVDRIAKG